MSDTQLFSIPGDGIFLNFYRSFTRSTTRFGNKFFSQTIGAQEKKWMRHSTLMFESGGKGCLISLNRVLKDGAEMAAGSYRLDTTSALTGNNDQR